MYPSPSDPTKVVPNSGREDRTRAVFATTNWSLVVAAAGGDNPEARPALEALCCAYWRPVYGFLRRRGLSPADAEDLTQGFFVRVLEGKIFALADRERGRFRSFLLACLSHYVTDEHRRAHAERRGGGRVAQALDFDAVEECYGCEAADEETPDQAYDRRWAHTVMEQALNRLEQEQAAAGHGAVFLELAAYLAERAPGGDYQAVAARTGLSPKEVAVAVHRLRRRFRECVREEVARTVAVPGEVEEEMRHLLSALRRGSSAVDFR